MLHSCRATWSYTTSLLIDPNKKGQIDDFDKTYLGYVNLNKIIEVLVKLVIE
jgi:hypothetical protein